MLRLPYEDFADMIRCLLDGRGASAATIFTIRAKKRLYKMTIRHIAARECRQCWAVYCHAARETPTRSCNTPNLHLRKEKNRLPLYYARRTIASRFAAAETFMMRLFSHGKGDDTPTSAPAAATKTQMILPPHTVIYFSFGASRR